MNEEAKISLDEWNEKMSTIFELLERSKPKLLSFTSVAAAKIKTTPSKEDIGATLAREQDGLS